MPVNDPEPSPSAWHRWAARDRSCSEWLHRGAAFPAIVLLLNGVSRLSDGIVWYVTVLVLPWVTPAGTACALRMVLLGLVNLAMYKVFKRHFARPRPFVACPGISKRARSLDEYSFPSGHVLHTMAFGIVLCAYFPGLSWVLWPFGVLVALSRVVLGLHYPSDVVVGAVLGWFTATSVLMLF
jgi:undecaprenyl-diphosphatase